MPAGFLKFAFSPNGQSLVESALALPILIILFMGCVQLVQIGVAHILVMEAAYESGRQFALDGDADRAGRVARRICGSVSPGRTEFQLRAGQCRVTHHLRPVFTVIKNVTIRHDCPAKLFKTGQDDLMP